MSFSYDIQFKTSELLARIRYMPTKELDALHAEVLTDLRSDGYLARFHRDKCDRIMKELARVRKESQEYELRDAMITFFRSNANLGASLRSVADRLVDAIEAQGGAIDASVTSVTEMLQQMRLDVAESDLPRLVSAMNEAIEERRTSPRRLR